MFLAVVQIICVNTPMLIFVKKIQVEDALPVQKLILNRPLKVVVGSTKLGCPEATLILLYFLPPYSIVSHSLPTLPQTSNFLTDMNHYSHPPFPAPYETPPPAHSFYPSCLPCKRESGLRLSAFNNCHIISPHASSISLPVPPHPNPQSKSFAYPSSPKHNKIKLKPYPGNSQTHQISLSRFPNRFVFPKLLVTNVESLNFEKLTELEVVSEPNLIDIIAVTEVQSHDPGSLRLTNYSELIKLRPSEHPLGKKGGGVLFFLLRVTFTQRLFKSLTYPSMMKSSG